MKLKQILSLLLCIIMLVIPLASCKNGNGDNTDGTGCAAHVDANSDGKCDSCGETVTVSCTQHLDGNNDGKCDNCGSAMSGTSAGKTVYTIEVKTVGGMPLSDIGVYVHTGDDWRPVAPPKDTDENGIVKFELDTSSDYSIELTGVPNGYNVMSGQTRDERYPMQPTGASIMLASAPIQGEEFSDEYELGDIMHDFTLRDVDGKEYKLSELLEEKRMVMLNYWYVDCSWCLKEFPGINASYKKYSDKVEILAINDYGDTLNEIKYFPTTGTFEGEENNLVFPFFKIEKKTTNLIRDKFVGEGYPTTVIIDRYGAICFMEAGAIIGEAKWDKIFSYFTADNYTQKLITSADELTPPEKPTVEWGGHDGIANNFNGNGDITVEYTPETSEKDAEYSWPFIPVQVGNISAVRPSNNTDNSYAILYANVQLKPGQAVMFDYFASTEYGNDNLYVLVDGKDICTLTGVNEKDKTDPNAWEQCCAYVDPRPVTADNKDVLATYSIAFVYQKNSDTSAGEDTVYLKNLRVINAEEIPTETYIFRFAATDLNNSSDGYNTYVDYVLGDDGYYHVRTADGKVGPLLLANFLSYSNFDSNKTMSQRVMENEELFVDGENVYKYWLIYANASSNSKINGYSPITEELKTYLDAYCNTYRREAGKDPHDDLWLQLCIYYDAYGFDKDGNPTAPVEDPIKGLTTLSAFKTELADPAPGDTAVYTVTYDAPIMPRGYLYEFIPSKDGVYRITSKSSSEVTGWIFSGSSHDWADIGNGERELITSSEHEERLCPELHVTDNNGNTVRDYKNVSLVTHLKAGEKYYIDIAYYDLYEVGSFDFEIKYVGETFNAFVMASPGPVTYIENASGGIGQLIAVGIDYDFKVDPADGKTYAYHVVERDQDGNVITYGSKIYADFYYPTIPFPSQSIVTLAELGAFDFALSEIDIDAINYWSYIRKTGKNFILEKWIGEGKTDAEEIWNSKKLDEILLALQKGSDLSGYEAADVAIAEEALLEGIYTLKTDWGMDNIGSESWTELNMDEALRGTFSNDADTKKSQEDVLAGIEQLWEETYRMDQVAKGDYEGEGNDMTELIQEYIALMENDPSSPERQGCVAVTKELSEILSKLFAKYVFSDVAHDWLKFCFYYDQLGTY